MQRPETLPAKGHDPSFWCIPKQIPEKGRVWIYRTASKGLGLPPMIVVNGRQYEELLPGTAYMLDVTPGKKQIMLAYDQDTLEVEIAAGEEVFVRFDLDPALFGRGFYPVRVGRQKAQAELHKHAGTDFSCTK